MNKTVFRAACFGMGAMLAVGACAPDDGEAPAAAEEAAVAVAETVAVEEAAVAEEAVEMVEYLFVQHSDGVRLADGKLYLDGISDSVMYFSDRPHRIVGREPLDAFIAAWSDGDSSFRAVPPNAIVTVVRDEVARDLAVVLKDPQMDCTTLVYDVDILSGPEAGEGTYATVFIDGLGKPLRGGEPGIPGAELGRPGIPGAEPGRPGKPGAELGKPGFEPNINAEGEIGVRANPKGRKMMKAEAADRIF